MSGEDAAHRAPYVAEGGPPGTRFTEIRLFEEIDSTNRYLLELAAADPSVRPGLVAVAEHQTAGRGRLDRRWEAPPGANLLVSLLLEPVLPLEDLHLVSVAVALAAADACRQVAGVEPLLKWPNDLLAGGRKLAGILAESTLPAGAAADPGANRAVVVGLGCNVRWPAAEGTDGDVPDELRDTATSLCRETGRDLEPAALLWAFLRSAERWLAPLDSAAGGAEVTAEYRRRCVTVGQEVRVDLGPQSVTGTAVELTGTGRLVVETPSGRVTVSAGDVVHVRPAS